jgi:GntR family transcriptional regulator
MKQREAKQLELSIDPKSPLPVYEQVKLGIKLLIYSGYLQKGDQLLPIRELATMLKINPNTIVKVYYQLDTEGLVYPLHGSGYFVKADVSKDKKPKQETFEKITDEYISRSLSLGFSPEDMNEALKKRIKTTVKRKK